MECEEEEQEEGRGRAGGAGAGSFVSDHLTVISCHFPLPVVA